MKGLSAFFLLTFTFLYTSAQDLHLKKRKKNALAGKEFAMLISDSSLSLSDREKIIFKEIKKGNVPDFLRKLVKIEVDWISDQKTNHISYYVLPDYFAIGTNNDFFYVPMTPILAQKVANLTKCSLPTKLLVDHIYKEAKIKLAPQPILPTKEMTTVRVFIAHTDSILKQLTPLLASHHLGELTAGNKKDIIISNKIYGESTSRVVIYGWHKLDGKAIQPVFNKHTNTWADYSHGIRLIQNSIYINQKKTSLKKALGDVEFCNVFSDEGRIDNPYYPIFKSY
ncbi:hypothetical protein EZ456_05520 [Pedobacter psychrodurus]|uniref:Uncharacterized protein n=1 Tax=Pedobacter psychrodurus TaxID=2530456 RepID=A0A4R0Q1T1_9SPHI|nr:hypothetical protein [Pedobacter psychrodurus]TCD28153.1 hypothetical protein EZ456_05520 [Pedobacter psychrodurus]